MTDKPEVIAFAGHVVFNPKDGSLTIDGREFPWHANIDFSMSFGANNITTLHLSIPCDQVTILPC